MQSRETTIAHFGDFVKLRGLKNSTMPSPRRGARRGGGRLESRRAEGSPLGKGGGKSSPIIVAPKFFNGLYIPLDNIYRGMVLCV